VRLSLDAQDALHTKKHTEKSENAGAVSVPRRANALVVWSPTRGCRSSSSSVRAARAVTRTRLISKMACRSRPRARRGSPVLSRKMGMSGIARANMPGPHLTSDLSTRKPNGLLSGSELLRTRSRAPISLPFSPAWNRAPPRQRRRAPLEVASRRASRNQGCGSVDVRMSGGCGGLKQPCARASRDLVAGGVFPEAIGRARWWWSPPPYRVARDAVAACPAGSYRSFWVWPSGRGCECVILFLRRRGARERRERGSGNQREEPEQDRSLMTFQKG